MYNLTKAIGAASTFAFLSACGGGGGGGGTADPIEPFPLASESGITTAIQLDATALTTGEAAGSWDSGDQSFTIGGETLVAIDPSDILVDFAFVRQVTGGSGGETLIYTPTLASNLPSGTAAYSGRASVVITDAAANSVSYTLTGSSTAVASLGTGSLDVTFAELDGERTASAAGPQPFTATGSIVIEDLALSSNGSISANSGTTTIISGVDTVVMDAGATTSASGGIAGTSGQEIAGVAAVSDADTIMLTTFAGQQ